MLTLAVIMLFFPVYFHFRVISQMPMKALWKILAFVLVAVIFCKFPILRCICGRWFSTVGVPTWFVNAYDILFSSLLFSVIILLFCDLVRFVLWGLQRFRVLPSKSFLPGWYKSPLFHLSVALFSLFLSVVSFYNALYAPPDLRSFQIHATGVREPIRIVVLSDLHFCARTPRARVENIVCRANELAPDAIIILGDVVDGDVGALGEIVEPLRNLKAKYGIYLVSGNHEYYSGYHAWMAFYRKLGIRTLDNAHAKIVDGVHLFGICDPQGERMHEGIIPHYEKIGETAKSLPEGAYKILLSHRPYLKGHEDFQQLFHLQLSGHTHGGTMPGLKSIVASLHGGFVSGLYRLGKTQIYVSNGTGIWDGFPVRLFTPAEITCITLSD